jgi:hypothetical protein
MTWARQHKVLAALLPALVLAMAIGITLNPGRQPSRQQGRPPGGTAAAPELPAVTSGAKWLTGPAGQLLEAVNADLGRLSTGERAGSRRIAKIAGSRLAADARTALGGPMPPARARIYRFALKKFERAGMYLTIGQFRKADTLLNAGDNDITKVTSAVNRLAEKSPQAAVAEPNGQ